MRYLYQRASAHVCVSVYRSIMIDTYVSQRVNSTAKDETSNLSLRGAKATATAALLHLEVAWVGGRCAFNAQHLFLQKKSTESCFDCPISLIF